jgi:hypothetical protein
MEIVQAPLDHLAGYLLGIGEKMKNPRIMGQHDPGIGTTIQESRFARRQVCKIRDGLPYL